MFQAKVILDLQDLLVKREILDQLPIGFVLWNQSGQLVFGNKTIENYFGYEASELLGKSIEAIFTMLFPRQYDNNRLVALLSGREVPKIVFNSLHKKGCVQQFEVISKPWLNATGEILGVVTLIRDLEPENKLVLWKSHFSCLLESIGRSVVAIDLKGQITTYNCVAEEMFDFKPDAVLNQSFTEVFGHVPKAQHYPLLTLQTGKVEKREVSFCPYVNKEGAFLHETSLIRNQENEIIGAMWFCQDITEHRRYEREVSRAELLAAVSELAAGTAHEIRNPLTTVRGFIQLLSAKHDEEKEYYELILAELDRANKIIGDFLALTKPSVNEMGLCSINHLIEDIVLLVEGQANLHCIEVHKELSGNIPLTCIHPDQIKQVFLNLIRNGIQAMPDGGRLYISTKLSENMDLILMEIRDTGVGILPENLSKLFAPYFSTKIEGSGLGLTISNRIIKNHGGDIKVESGGGQGTIFRVCLPVSNPLTAVNYLPCANI